MGKITWIAGGSINETAKNDITTYTGGNSNSYGQQVTHDAPEINWGDEPEDPPDINSGIVTLTEVGLRSYIQGNFDGSTNAYKPGNTGIERNSDGSNHLDAQNGDIISLPKNGEDGKQETGKDGKLQWISPPYGVESDKDNKPLIVNGGYIPGQTPPYKDGSIINPEEICFIVTTFAPGTRKGDIGYIERIDSETGEVMSSVFCMLADSNGSGVYDPSELKVDNSEKDVFFVDSTTKTKTKVQRLKTEISYAATKALGIKLSGAIFVNQITFDENFKNYKNRYIPIQGTKNQYREIINGDRPDFRNFDYLQKNYSLPATLKVNIFPTTFTRKTKKGNIIITENIQQRVEVFKFNGVKDEYAILRIWIFKNSGDGKARTQDEINVAGKYYKSILIGNPPSQTATDKKYFLHNE